MLKKSIIFTLAIVLLTGNIFPGFGYSSPIAYAEEISAGNPTDPTANQDIKNIIRYSGSSRYNTAVEISAKNWTEAGSVVLARGDSFPDALVGAVLANSTKVSGPLLLTEPDYLRPEVLAEIKRLGAETVYILGGTGAISGGVAQDLSANGLTVVRIQGEHRYETAANIATEAIPANTKAFLASGQTFADALSISSYAAAKGIPLLLTAEKEVPEATLDALKKLGVTEITLIGGEKAIGPTVKAQLEQAGYKADRLSGSDRFQTNTTILNKYNFNTEQVVVATGTNFPDALAGSILAAKNNNPLMLVPKEAGRIPGSATAGFIEENKESVEDYLIAGGSGAVSFSIEFYVRNGKVSPKLSLQFWDGYDSKAAYERLLSYVPGKLTDTIDILSPNYTGDLRSDGSFSYKFPNADVPRYLTALAQSKGARVVPMILADGQIANAMLLDADKRRAFADSAVRTVQETGADGILVDLEMLSDNTEQGLTLLMKDIYERLNPKGKMVLISIMSKTSKTAEPWYKEYNYSELAKYTDYIQIMSYDKHYSTSQPGPIAPLDWVRQVMTYAKTEIPAEKILMGVPYYGRTWRRSGDGWTSMAFGYAKATDTAAQYGATIYREKTASDPVGVPTFKYIDASGYQRTAYFDDRLSLEAKYGLVDEYNLGGVGSWAMGWVNEVSSAEIYLVLKNKI